MDVVYANTDASIPLDTGLAARVRKGEHWVASDPLVQEHPELFSSDARYGARYTVRPDEMAEPPGRAPVETATAAPGETRSTSRRRP